MKSPCDDNFITETTDFNIDLFKEDQWLIIMAFIKKKKKKNSNNFSLYEALKLQY